MITTLKHSRIRIEPVAEAYPVLDWKALKKISTCLEVLERTVFDGVHEDVIAYMTAPLIDVLKQNGVRLEEVTA